MLLTVFNSIWESGVFPPSWREATVVAILEPDKDSTDNNSAILTIRDYFIVSHDKYIKYMRVYILKLRLSYSILLLTTTETPVCWP